MFFLSYVEGFFSFGALWGVLEACFPALVMSVMVSTLGPCSFWLYCPTRM